MEDLQVENGNFTRIVNPLIMELVKINFKGCSLAIAFYTIRKTFGYHKKSDEISLSQFQKDLCRSRKVIIRGIKELVKMNILVVVSKGDNTGNCNEYKINKYYKTWVVPQTALVPCVDKPSAIRGSNLVPQTGHTKEIKKQKKDSHINYLKDIPQEDIEHFRQTFKCDISNIKTKANSLYDYCKAKGRIYKNYKAFLSNALRKDFGERTQPLVIKDEKIIIEKDRTPEEQEIINKGLEKVRQVLKNG
jgi:phage replication O-like protein O